MPKLLYHPSTKKYDVISQFPNPIFGGRTEEDIDAFWWKDEGTPLFLHGLSYCPGLCVLVENYSLLFSTLFLQYS